MDMPEVMGFEIAGMAVGIIQTVKDFFELEGKAARGVAILISLVLFGYWSSVQAGVMPDGVVLYTTIFLRSVGYALAIPGAFSAVKDEFLPRIATGM